MTLSPDADKAQVRQAVIHLQERVDIMSADVNDQLDKLTLHMEEAERRIELLSVALKSTLTSRPDPAPRPASPVSNHHYDTPEIAYNSLKGMYQWNRPEGGTTFFTDDRVPAEIAERFQREKGTPRPEVEPD